MSSKSSSVPSVIGRTPTRRPETLETPRAWASTTRSSATRSQTSLAWHVYTFCWWSTLPICHELVSSERRFARSWTMAVSLCCLAESLNNSEYLIISRCFASLAVQTVYCNRFLLLKAVQHIQTKFLNCFLNLFHGWETGHVEQAKSKLRTWFLDAFKVRIDWDYLGRFADRKGRHPAVRMKCSPELNFPQGQRMCCQFSLLFCRQAKQISSLHVPGAQYP